MALLGAGRRQPAAAAAPLLHHQRAPAHAPETLRPQLGRAGREPPAHVLAAVAALGDLPQVAAGADGGTRGQCSDRGRSRRGAAQYGRSRDAWGR